MPRRSQTNLYRNPHMPQMTKIAQTTRLYWIKVVTISITPDQPKVIKISSCRRSSTLTRKDLKWKSLKRNQTLWDPTLVLKLSRIGIVNFMGMKIFRLLDSAKARLFHLKICWTSRMHWTRWKWIFRSRIKRFSLLKRINIRLRTAPLKNLFN